MTKRVIEALKQGLKVMQVNTHLLLIVVLVFVFPLVFLLINQSFFDTAMNNINTAQKQRIGILHDSLAIMLGSRSSEISDLLPQSVIQSFSTENPDITEILVSKQTPEGFLIMQSLDATEIGTIDNDVHLYQTALGDPKQSLIFEYQIDGLRYWSGVRKITVNNETLFIVTGHSFRNLDSVMTARRQQSYLGFTLIFAFLMALAYWMARQIHWRSEAEQISKTLEERNLFTNVIAHEFRAPLTAINGYASFLAESKNIKGDETKYVENIQISTSRLLALVNDFLEVARIQSGKLNLKLEKVELEPVFFNVTETLKSTALEKGLTLAIVKSRQQLFLHTDKDRLTQVLTNIVSNSIKYTDKGSVTVMAESNPVSLTIRIEDTGMGISADDQKKLFEAFMRVGGVENSKTVGTGLGMWITKQLVEHLGGTIGVESIKGVGTHVVLTFKYKKIAIKR
jgi:signal transduction histidine kinase